MPLEKLLQQAQSALDKSAAQQWEIVLSHSMSLALGVKEGTLDKLQEAESLGLSIRVLKDQRLGFSYLMGSDYSQLGRVLELALAGAAASDPEPGFSFAPASNSSQNGQPPMPAGLEPIGDKVKRARLMASSALAASPKVSHVYPAETSQSLNQVFIRNSLGLNSHYRYSLVWAGCAAVAQENGQQEEVWEGKTARYWHDLDLAEVGRQAGLKAAASLGAALAPGGRYQVMLNNEVAAYFVDLLSASLKADNISTGRSLLAGRLGSRVLSPLFNLADNPLHERAPFSRPFDDEGTLSQLTPLFVNGVMQNFVCDRRHAERLKRTSTGNCQRAGVKSPPEVGFSNLMLAPGPTSRRQMVGKMQNGIIVEQVLGGHTADPVSGQFSLGLAGKLVRGGEIIGPIRGNALAGQVIELFSNISLVGDDQECFGQTWAPSVLIPELTISGAAA